MFDHRGEEKKDFGVASVLRCRLVVVDEKFETRQELLVKDSEVLVFLLEDVGLDQFEDVSANGFHWLHHGVVLGLVADDGI